MKIFFTLLLFVSLSAGAEDVPSKDDLCKAINDMAGSIMESRQNGVTMQSLFQEADNIGVDKSVTDSTKSIIMDAYSLPRMSSNKGRADMVVDFQNKYFLECHKLK